MDKFLSWASRKSFTNAFEPVFKERTLQEEGPILGSVTFYYHSLRSFYRTQLPTQRNMGPVTRQDDLHDCSGQTQSYLSSWLPAPNPFQPVVEVFLSLQFLVFLLDNNTRKYFFKITTKQYHILPSLHIIKWILLPQFQFLLWIFKTIKHIEMFSVRIVI